MTPAESDPLDLTGKRALVCGSTQGIGRACARAFARRGAQVTLLARNEETLRETRDEIAEISPAATARSHGYLVAEFGDPERVGTAVRAEIEITGAYHILLNNTGGPAGGPILDAKPEEFLAAFTRHLVVNQVLVQTLVPGMKAAGYGRILNVISTSVRQPIPGLGVSNTIRAAVAAWAKTLSREVAVAGITVNNILPGATLTGRLSSLIAAKARASGRSEAEVELGMKAEIPAGRFGGPEEVADAAAFLASPAAAYVTGVSLPVDGGRTSCL